MHHECRGWKFKAEISHSVTQLVIYPSFLFFKVYFTYKFLFGPDQINFYIRSISNWENKIRFSENFPCLFPTRASLRLLQLRPTSKKVWIKSAGRTIDLYRFLSPLFPGLFVSFCSGQLGHDKICKYLLASGNHNTVYLRPFCTSTGSFGKVQKTLIIFENCLG